MSKRKTQPSLHKLTAGQNDEDIYDEIYPQAALYVDKAINAKSYERKLAYAHKACRVAPYHFGAKMFLLDLDEQGIMWQLDYCRQCLEEIRAILDTHGVFNKKDVGQFYHLYAETHTYLFFMCRLTDILNKLGRNSEALAVSQEILRLDTQDNYYIKNTILRLTIILEKHQLAQKIIDLVPDVKSYTDFQIAQCEFVLLELILAYKMGDYKKMPSLMDKLNNLNEFVLERVILEEQISTQAEDDEHDYLSKLSETFDDDDPRWEDIDRFKQLDDLDRIDDSKKIDANYIVAKNESLFHLIPYFTDYIQDHYQFTPDAELEL